MRSIFFAFMCYALWVTTWLMIVWQLTWRPFPCFGDWAEEMEEIEDKEEEEEAQADEANKSQREMVEIRLQ